MLFNLKVSEKTAVQNFSKNQITVEKDIYAFFMILMAINNQIITTKSGKNTKLSY